MPEQNQDNEKLKAAKRAKKRLWLTGVIALFIVAAVIGYRVLTSKSADEQLAAIEAGRAIPDSQNAAVIYDELLEDYNASALSPAFLDASTDDLTLRDLWSAEDYPELAQWIKQQQGLIAKLLEAAKKDKCSFPIYSPAEGIEEHIAKRVERIKAMRTWARLLVRAANNDLAEGRIDQALLKYSGVIRMGEHGRRQPIALDYVNGIAMETLGLRKMRIIIMKSDVTEEQLRAIEATLPQTSHNWTEDSQVMLEVERLYSRKMPPQKVDGLLNQLNAWLRRSDESAAVFNRVHHLYLRLFAERRRNRILVSLRRYKNKHGRWPQSLDEIKSSLPEEVLTDAQNGGPFVYRLAEDSFILYGKGKNNIDDNGIYKPRLDDRLIWPPKMPKKKDKETDTK